MNVLSKYLMRRVLIAPVVAFVLVGCQPKSQQNQPVNEDQVVETGESLVGSDWNVIELEGQAAATGMGDKPASIGFEEDGRAHAFSGCNRMSGSYAVEGNQLKFGQMAMTKMFCEGAMDLESTFSRVIGEIDSFRIVGNTLELMKGDIVVARLIRG